MIADVDRAFESDSGVVPISLQNIHQVKVVKPDGEFAWGRWDDLPGAVAKIVEGARWRVNYEAIPAEFHAAAKRMEFGDYRPALAAIRYGAQSNSAELRKTAALMQQSIQRRMTDALAQAVDGLPADDAWAQFDARQQIADRFAPHPLPKKMDDELARLRKDPAVQEEMRAARGVAANAPGLASPDGAERRRAAARLQRVIAAYPDTRSAAAAQELLDSLDVAAP